MATAKGSKSNGSTPSAADLADQVAQLQSQIGDMAELIKEVSVQKQGQIKEAAASVAATAKDAAKDVGEEAYDAASAQVHAASQTAQDFVQDRPTAALGIAAGIGFAIGLWATRR